MTFEFDCPVCLTENSIEVDVTADWNAEVGAVLCGCVLSSEQDATLVEKCIEVRVDYEHNRGE